MYDCENSDHLDITDETKTLHYQSERAALCAFVGYIVKCSLCNNVISAKSIMAYEPMVHRSIARPGIHIKAEKSLESIFDNHIETHLPPPNHFDPLLNKWIDVCDDCLPKQECHESKS